MSAVAKRRSTAIVATGCLLAVSVGLGRAVVETEAIQEDPGVMVVTTVGVMVALGIMVTGPIPSIAALAALTVLPLLPQASLVAGVDLGAADAFFGALVCWWLVRTIALERRPSDGEVRASLSGAAVLVLLAYIGLTVLFVAAVDPGRASVSLVSWLRLLETALVGWLVAAFVRTPRDAAIVLSVVAATGAVTVLLALAGGSGGEGAGALGERGGGAVNPNALGLISGMLILMSAFRALGPSLVHRVPLAALGALGLIQAKSVGALVGTSVALLLGIAFMVVPGHRILSGRWLRAVVVLGVAVGVAYAAAAVVRPSNLPTSEHFRDSSAGQRTVLAAAGLEIAARHPLVGVGWRRSEQPDVIGDPDVNRELRARFPATKNEFFPDVQPSSVHNAYIQVAADLGIIGLALLIFAVVTVGRGITRTLRGVNRRRPEWPQLWFLAWAVVLIMVWWNDNPIFGGQRETVLLAIFIGAIAGLGRASASAMAAPKE